MDAHLVRKRLAFIADCVADLRKHARVDMLASDPVQRGFVEHTLQVAVQAMLDVAYALAAAGNLGEPRDNREVFDRLAAAGWLPTELRDTCRRMVAFRNVVVHRYLQVDVRVAAALVTKGVDDLLAFVRAIDGRLGSG